MEIGTIVKKEDYTKVAIKCNKLGDRAVKLIDGQYVIVPVNPISIEEQVARLEAETGLTRVMREGILAEGSPYSLFIKEKALEIEELASQLRTDDNQSTDELTGATLE